MKFSTRISRSPFHLIKFWMSEYPNTVGSSGRTQKSASWCFVFWSLLSAPNSVFDDLILFGKLMKFSTRISRRPSHLIKFWASEYPNTVGSSGRSQKSGSSCFDHNFLLRTPILMILDSMESLWNYLKEYPEVHIIRSSFGHWFNASV